MFFSCLLSNKVNLDEVTYMVSKITSQKRNEYSLYNLNTTSIQPHETRTSLVKAIQLWNFSKSGECVKQSMQRIHGVNKFHLLRVH